MFNSNDVNNHGLWIMCWHTEEAHTHTQRIQNVIVNKIKNKKIIFMTRGIIFFKVEIK